MADKAKVYAPGMSVGEIKKRLEQHYVVFDGVNIMYLGPEQMMKDVQYMLDTASAYAKLLAGVNGADLDGGE